MQACSHRCEALGNRKLTPYPIPDDTPLPLASFGAPLKTAPRQLAAGGHLGTKAHYRVHLRAWVAARGLGTQGLWCVQNWKRIGKGYIAAFAHVGSLAEAKTVPVTKPVPAGEQEWEMACWLANGRYHARIGGLTKGSQRHESRSLWWLFCIQILVPVLVVVWDLNWLHSPIICAAIFMVAAWTDWLDGYLARRLGISTVFGAFLDPVADKIMVNPLGKIFVAMGEWGFSWFLKGAPQGYKSLGLCGWGIVGRLQLTI
eukprot:1160469-Pelagomonas_calceolata.AAC.14